MLAFNPDVDDLPPENKTVALSYKDSARSNTYNNFALHVSPSSLNTSLWRYTQPTPPIAPGPSQDERLNDFGRLSISTEGQTNTKAIGELTVVYTIELKAPKLSQYLNTAVSQGNYGVAANVTNLFPFGVPENQTITGGLPCNFVGNEIRFHRAGRYLLDYTAAALQGADQDPATLAVTPGMTVSPRTDECALTGGGTSLTQSFLCDVIDVVGENITSLGNAVGSALSLTYPTSWVAEGANAVISAAGLLSNLLSGEVLDADLGKPHPDKPGFYFVKPKSQPHTPIEGKEADLPGWVVDTE